MKEILKIIFVIFSFFWLVLLITSLTVGNIWQEALDVIKNLKDTQNYFIGFLISFLLFLDLFIIVPTFTTLVFAWYSLWFFLWTLFVLLWLYSAGISGYFLGKKYWRNILFKIYSNPEKIWQIEDAFHKNGIFMIIFSRSAPLLPELVSVLEWITWFPFWKYLLYFSIITLPYTFLGISIWTLSDWENPEKTVLVIITGFAFFWTVGILCKKYFIKNI